MEASVCLSRLLSDMQLTQTNVQLTFEDAEKILQQKYPQAHVYDEELDIWGGQVVYKLEALNGTQKIKMTIDANNGNKIGRAHV